MLKQQARLFTKISILIDVLSIVTAFFLAYAFLYYNAHSLQVVQQYSWVLLIIIPTWLLLLSYTGMYGSMRIKRFGRLIEQLVKVHLVGGMVMSSIIFMVDPKGFSRMLVGIFILISLALMTTTRTSLKQVLQYIRRRGYNSRNLLIVGNDEKALNFVQLLKAHADWGLVVAGVIPFDNKSEGKTLLDSCNLDNIDNLILFCKEKTVDEVIFSVPSHQISLIEEHIATLEEMGITVRMVMDLYDLRSGRKEISLFHGEFPMLTFHSKAFDAEQLFLKRCLDIVGSLVGLAITALLFPFIALAIKLESKGPLFFGQNRVGECGRIFKCWKFRSMFIDAEERKKDLMAQNEMQGAMFKMKDDPRVTKVGNFIRKTSLDELPQFWNVLHGEMSLVGTRPPTPDEVSTYENWHRKRICMKPGISGLWQVSGRNQIQDFDDVARLDIQYIENWTFWLDVKILFQTLWVVILKRGAS